MDCLSVCWSDNFIGKFFFCGWMEPTQEQVSRKIKMEGVCCCRLLSRGRHAIVIMNMFTMLLATPLYSQDMNSRNSRNSTSELVIKALKLALDAISSSRRIRSVNSDNNEVDHNNEVDLHAPDLGDNGNFIINCIFITIIRCPFPMAKLM